MVKSKPPHGDFNANPRTLALREDVNLTEGQKEQIRHKKRSELTPIAALASEYGVGDDVIKIVLAAMRTPIAVHRRRTLNVGLDAHRFVKKEQRRSEPMWQTMDRLLSELEQLRAVKNTRKRNRLY